jgi:beta-galactosidase
MDEMRQALVDAGFDVPLFECNPPDVMKNGLLTNLFQVVNFGSDPAKNFAALREILPQGPLMCSEFYPGWFDTWGAAASSRQDAEKYLPTSNTCSQSDASFSIYMAHGGTTFGLWSGCDRPFKPDTSSYDYDAPISEAGWATEKFFQTRELFAKYLLPGEKLPEPPAPNPVVALRRSIDGNRAGLRQSAGRDCDETPRNMEAYDQGYGCILYRTKIPAGAAPTLEAAAIHDFGYVFLDGQRVGILDRRSASAKIVLPARAQDSQLDILVEPMGRVNFGRKWPTAKASSRR